MLNDKHITCLSSRMQKTTAIPKSRTKVRLTFTLETTLLDRHLPCCWRNNAGHRLAQRLGILFRLFVLVELEVSFPCGYGRLFRVM